ncbi:Thiamine kinase [Neobacillus rhizosphaerae]|uniref:Thiamine kinase n=1 Tax=Neobacillus rhizosphaerae TaxID=2880965 RepID=A0ABM9EMV0_9BACI|nr:NTP transferase domain-containing protein [Neobacillus rhizosphaerae]CAH2713937.1 Thiamine kinase [Neobacillus rhizosphaerae]
MYRFQMLDALTQNSKISQRSLAELCSLSVGKVNYMLNQLADEKMIVIKKSGKANHYEVTENGKEYLKNELDQLHGTKVIIHNNERKIVKQAVILAAGTKAEFDKPACLLPIKDTTLLERNIGILENNGIEKIIIVTGYKKEAFDKITALKENPAIHFVENPRYLWTGSMASLATASELLTDDFILLEDDILIEESAVTELLNHEERDCLLVTQESGFGDEAFIEIQNNYLYKISKDIHQLNRIDGEMTGITKFSYEVYKEMLQLFETNKNPYVNYEYILLDVSRIINVSFLKIADLVWAEIDSYEHHFKVVDKFYPMLQRKEAEFKERELKQVIATALNMGIDEVTSVEALGGLTNRNFKVTVAGQEYAARIPGKGTEQYINRLDEKVNSEITSLLGINPEVIYFNAETGLKIVRFIPDAETLNPKTGTREDNLIQVAGIFQTLHTSGETFNARFDVFEKITEYETLLEVLNGVLFDGHDAVKQQVLELEEYYKSLNIKPVPCHNDPLAENFVKSGEEKMFLIDWEFSGMNDPLWDVAAYIIEAELSPAEEKLFLLEYFNGDVTTAGLQQLLLNKIFLDFLWTIWALMKEAGGEDFGSYAFTRFTRAQNNLQEYQNHYKGYEILGKI